MLVRGVEGAPQLWEPFSGARRAVAAEAVDGGVRVRVPFADGPCALLVWGAAADGVAPARATGATARTAVLDGPWEVQVEATLEDDWGDLDAPAPGPGPVTETWALEHRTEPDAEWRVVHATYGPRALVAGPAAPRALPSPASGPAAAGGAGSAGWREAVWSPSRGIHKDPVHWEALGPSGRVPEEFIDVGAVDAGQAVHVRAVVGTEDALDTHLAVGAAAAKAAWLNGEAVDLEGAGHLATAPVRLRGGDNVLDLRLTAVEAVDPLRAHFAFVADAEGYRRPEWLRAAGPSSKSAVVAFSTVLSLPADAETASVLLGANGPCRLVVDGVEAGRQGGFDPYEEGDFDRLQPYDLTAALGAGDHEIVVELLDMGRSRPAAILDALVHTAHGTHAVRSDDSWTATRDGRPVEVDLRLTQAYGDPAYAHAWRRPHPLPDGAWLEPGRAVADAGAPVTIAAGTATVAQWLRLTLPPGTERIEVPLAPGCTATVEVDGHAVPAEVDGSGTTAAALPPDGGAPVPCQITVEPAPGLSGGALLAGPVRCHVGPGRTELADWQAIGLQSHSGAVRYRRHIEAPGDGGTGGDAPPTTILDLGEVRGTAEVLVDGRRVGVRVCSPYTFDLTGRVGPAGARLEVLVCNTLAPHLDAVGPTPFVFAGQKRSGLFGPVSVTTFSRP